MKKILFTILVVFIGSFVTIQSISAERVFRYQHLDPEEFIRLQKEFITKEAGLSEKEASQFFKLYFELQDKKRDNNHKINRLMKKMNGNLAEKDYAVILDEIYQLRQVNTKLEADYYHEYTKVISSKKVYKVMKAESQFRRKIIRGMNRNRSRENLRRNCQN